MGLIALLSAAGSIVVDIIVCNRLNLLLIACYRLNLPNHHQHYLQNCPPLPLSSPSPLKGGHNFMNGFQLIIIGERQRERENWESENRFWSRARYLTEWRTDRQVERETERWGMREGDRKNIASRYTGKTSGLRDKINPSGVKSSAISKFRVRFFNSCFANILTIGAG